MRKFAPVLLVLVMSSVLAQEMSHRLSNQDIIDMTALGLSDDVIITKIHGATKPENLAFDTSTAGLKNLTAAHVSDAVIKVMINPAAPPPPAPSAGGASDPNLPPQEVGVYWKDGHAFMRIEGEILSQAKVGGRAGNYLTYGLRSQHWDAYVNGPTSKNRVNERHPMFYFYVPDGASASDFMLIRLEKKGNRREFQVGSFGGIAAGKSGVKRPRDSVQERTCGHPHLSHNAR